MEGAQSALSRGIPRQNQPHTPRSSSGSPPHPPPHPPRVTAPWARPKLLFSMKPFQPGPKAGVAPPSVAHPEFGSDTPSLPELGIPNTLKRENSFFWVPTCLQTLGAWLQGRDEVTRLSSWASRALWRSPPHHGSDLPSRRVSQPPGRRGAAKLNLGHWFLPVLFTKNIDVCLVCRQPTFPFFFFYVSHSSCAACPPKRPCSTVEEASWLSA